MSYVDDVKKVVATQLNISDESKITEDASFVDDLNAYLIILKEI